MQNMLSVVESKDNSRKNAVLFDNFAIFVISVKSFADRHAHVEQLSERFGFEYEFVWKYDAEDLAEGDLGNVCSGLSRRSASNSLKHIEAQRLFLAGEKEYCLILEDDVIFYHSFVRDLAIIESLLSRLDPGWLVFLGGADNKLDDRFISARSLSLIERSLTTAEAYVVDRRSCMLRLKWLETNIIDRQADHQLKLMDANIGVTQYSVSHPIATQGSITGKFTTSLDQSRAKRGRLFLFLRFHLNRCRRQIIPRLKRLLLENNADGRV